MSGKRIVVMGAGSRSFGRGMIVDLLNARELADQGYVLWFVDILPELLKAMQGFAGAVRRALDSRMEIHATIDRKEALPGAPEDVLDFNRLFPVTLSSPPPASSPQPRRAG